MSEQLNLPADHRLVQLSKQLGKTFPPTVQQARVIEYPLAPLLVVAGAGSGKTTTMAMRVASLVAEGQVCPEEILGLTFTRKATANLDRDIRELLARLDTGEILLPPTIRTYDAFASELAKDYGMRIGANTDAHLITDGQAQQLMQQIVRSAPGNYWLLDLTPSALAANARALAVEMRNNLLDVDQAREALIRYSLEVASQLAPAGKPRANAATRRLAEFATQQPPAALQPLIDAGMKLAVDGCAVVTSLISRYLLLDLVERYQQEKIALGVSEFADHTALAVEIAQLPDVQQALRSRYRLVLLDEFQDTSVAQLHLLRSLFGNGHAVTAVGDPHQAIYGWRGASAQALADFRDTFGGEEPVAQLELTYTFRNSKTILDLANHTAAPLRDISSIDVHPLSVPPQAAAGQTRHAIAPTQQVELETVADAIQTLWQPHRGETIAVLCRTNKTLRKVAQMLHDREIACKFSGMAGLLAIPEVADVRALIDVAVDASRGDAAARLLTRLRLGITDIHVLEKWAKHCLPNKDFTANLAETLTNLPPADFHVHNDPTKVLSPTARQRLEHLRAAIIEVRRACARPLPDIIAVAERALGVDIDVLARPEARGVSARRYLDQFRRIARNFVPISPTPAPLDDFVTWLQMVDEAGEDLSGNVAMDLDTDGDDAAVELLTMHTAKGLEFTHVIVAGMTDAEFPNNHYLGKLEISDSAWLTATDMLPYQLRKDAAALPELLGPPSDSALWQLPPDHPLIAYVNETNVKKRLDGFKRASGFYGLNEERRLAYVAFTRAEQTLLLTTSRAVPSSSDPLAISARRISRFISEQFDDGDPHRHVGPNTDKLTTRQDAWIAAPPPVETLTGAPLQGRYGTLELSQELREWEELQEQLQAESTDEVVTPTYPASLHNESRAAALQPLAARISALAELSSSERQDLLAASTADNEPEPFSLRLLWQESELLLQELERTDTNEIYAPDRMSATGAQHAAANPQQYLEYLRRPLPSEPMVAARLGTEFHKWVEDYYATRSQQLFVEPHADADTAAAITAWQQQFLQSRFATMAPIATETPATLNIERDGAPLRIDCKIDAVFAVDDRYLIVDWKTGRAPQNEQEWQLRALQLQLYRHAYAQTNKIDLDLIDAVLYYVASDTELAAPALSYDEITAKLACVDDSVIHEVLHANPDD